MIIIETEVRIYNGTGMQQSTPDSRNRAKLASITMALY